MRAREVEEDVADDADRIDELVVILDALGGGLAIGWLSSQRSATAGSCRRRSTP
jgi:hypothetical protein